MAAQPRLLLAVALAIAPLSAALVAPATPFLGLRALSVHAGTVAPRARPGRAVVALRMSAASSGVRPLPPPRLRGEFVCSSPGLLSYRTITSAPPSAPRALSVARALPRPPHRPARLKRVPAIFALAWQTASDADLQDKQLKDKIANFYDQSSPLWEDIWGMLCTRARSLVSRAFRVVCVGASLVVACTRVGARFPCLHACMPACLHACMHASLPPCLPASLPSSLPLPIVLPHARQGSAIRALNPRRPPYSTQESTCTWGTTALRVMRRRAMRRRRSTWLIACLLGVKATHPTRNRDLDARKRDLCARKRDLCARKET